MRYTSESTMDDRVLRDVERWKDKIEVRLDNRQVFFLFFGSALVACLLFILGVIVGKRLESRGRAMAPEIEDPLALLDKVAASPRAGAEAPPALPRMLFGGSAAPAKVAPPAGKQVAPASKTTAAPTKTVAAVEAHPPAARVTTAKAEASVGKPAVPPTPKKVAVVAPPAPVDAKGKGHFTLQLGSFPDRAEAEAFAKRFTAQGAYVIASDIPGKGTWFRVRVGDYASAKDAIAGKSAFEKQHNVIAYVVGPR